MSQIEAIVSDADGTLVDTVSLIRHGQFEAATTFLQRHGIPGSEIPDYEEYEQFLNQHVGGHTRQTLELTIKALYEDRAHHLEGVDYHEIDQLLIPIQDRIAPKHVKAFPGLSNFLRYVGQHDIKLAIFTSGTRHHIVRNFGIALAGEMGDYSELYKDTKMDMQTQMDLFLKRMQEVFGIATLKVVTCDEVGDRTKPDPLSIEMAMEQMDATTNKTMVMGDLPHDIQAGVRAGVVALTGITHGFSNEADLIAAGATRIVTSLSEVPTLIKP